jgi:hypothetical protein
LLGGVAGAPGSGLPAGEGSVQIDMAKDTLRRAVAAGYRYFVWMQRDPDLGALRSRSDFGPLMMDLVFPRDPFAETR